MEATSDAENAIIISPDCRISTYMLYVTVNGVQYEMVGNHFTGAGATLGYYGDWNGDPDFTRYPVFIYWSTMGEPQTQMVFDESLDGTTAEVTIQVEDMSDICDETTATEK